MFEVFVNLHYGRNFLNSKVDGLKYEHKGLVKVLQYFPLISKLQRLFMCSNTTKSMR